MIKAGIAGCNGRMGSMLIREILSGSHEGIGLAGGTSPDDVEADYFFTKDAGELFERSDVFIDFTVPAASVKHARLAVEHNVPIVVCTTGLSEEDEAVLKDAAKSVGVVYAANTSIGVNLLLSLVEQAAAKLSEEYDIEVFETHHRNKVDAPSGTALALGRAAQKGRGGGEFVTDRNGKRKTGDIGFAVQRGGDIIGEHAVTFFGDSEYVSLVHKAGDRSLFAKGALKATAWLVGKPAGLYSMRDVLGL